MSSETSTVPVCSRHSPFLSPGLRPRSSGRGAAAHSHHTLSVFSPVTQSLEESQYVWVPRVPVTGSRIGSKGPYSLRGHAAHTALPFTCTVRNVYVRTRVRPDRGHAARKKRAHAIARPGFLPVRAAAARGPRACGSRSTSRRNRVTVRVRRLPAARITRDARADALKDVRSWFSGTRRLAGDRVT